MQALTSLPESRYVSLIDRIKAQHAWELQHGWKSEESTYPPATEEQLRASEQALGFLLPPLLRTLYAQVANGGFGPDLPAGAFLPFLLNPNVSEQPGPAEPGQAVSAWMF